MIAGGRAFGLLFAIAFAVRVALLLAFPGPHGDDAAARLAYCDRLVLAYQLPLPQLLVVATRWLAPDPFWTQLVFAAIGSGLAPLLAAVVGRLESPAAGRLAGALAALHPLVIYYSLVPYQEGPMLALLLAGTLALIDGREARAALWLGLAALCRYEAWVALALVIARRRSLRALVLFGWAPLIWVVTWGGLSPRGTYVFDLDPEALRLSRLGFLAGKVVEYSGAPMALAAAAGGIATLARGDRRWRRAALFLTVVVAAVALAGHEFPPGSGRVSERLAHLPALALCAAAAVALARAAGASVWRGLAVAGLVALVAVSWSRHTRAVLAQARADPGWRLARAVAAFAEDHLGHTGRLGVAAPPVPASAIEDYVRKVGHSGGDTDRARATAEIFSRLPPDGVRVAAHLARGAGTVVPGSEPAALIAVFDDTFAPPGRILARFDAPPRHVVIRAGRPHLSAPR